MKKQAAKTRKRPAPPKQVQPVRRWRWTDFIAPLLIILTGIIAYHNSLYGVFVLDDTRSIVENPSIRSLIPTQQSLLGPPWTTFNGRPLTTFSIAVNYRLHGLRLPGYHIFNITVHILAALTLFGVMRRTLRLPLMQKHFQGREDLLAAIISLIWVAHPLTSASVTYISQRAESMMGLFYLLTVYCFIRGATERRNLWYGLSVVTCLLGLASKEPIATVPIFILLYDRILLAGSFTGAFRERKWTHVALFCTWLPLIGLLSLEPHGPDVSFGFEELSGWDYLKAQTKSIWLYLKLSVWPSPLILYHGWSDYDVPIPRQFAEYAPWGIAVLVLLGLSIWAIVRGMAVGLIGAWFFLILAPSSTILAMPTEVIAEYRMYLPVISIIVLTVLCGQLLIAYVSTRLPLVWRAPLQLASMISAGIVVVALVVVTYDRNKDFHNLLGFWRDAADKMPANSTALGNLGIIELESGQFSQAEQHLRRSIELRPKNGTVRAALGQLAERSGNLAEAADQYQQAIYDAPRIANSYLFLAQVLNAQGRRSQAADTLIKGVRELPYEQSLHLRLGVFLFQVGNAELGLRHLEQAIKLDPDTAHTYTKIGQMFQQSGMPDRALEYVRKAQALTSNSPEMHTVLGAVLSSRGNYAEALRHYQHAISLDPDDAAVLNNLAWLEATAPDNAVRNGNEAIRHARQAIELTAGRNPLVLDTLAAAYAEAGRFDLAVSTLEEALRLIGEGSKSVDAREMRKRLEMFRNRQPFRETAPQSSTPTTRS